MVGLHSLREATKKPVLGISECGILTALTLGQKFGVIAILKQSIPRHLRYVGALGVSQRFAGELPVGLRVVELSDEKKTFRRMVEVAKTLRDAVAMARAKPESVRIGVFGAGNKSLVAMLEDRTGAKFLQVPFKSSTETVTSLLGNHIDIAFETVGTLLGQKGKLKALSYGDVKPSPLLPGVPTVPEMYKFSMVSWFGVIGPAGTPPNVVSFMAREIPRALKDPKIAQLVESNGFSLLANTPDEFVKMVRAEVEANADIVRKFPDIK